VFTRSEAGGAAHEVRDFLEALRGHVAGPSRAMGYLGNLVAVLPDYAEFDAVIAGDSLFAPARRKPAFVSPRSALGRRALQGHSAVAPSNSVSMRRSC
jgi:hypothetical protein